MSESAGPAIEVRIGPGSLEDILQAAEVAADLGADRIGVGTPLIYAHGMKVIARIRERTRDVPVLANLTIHDGCFRFLALSKSHGAAFGTVSAIHNHAGCRQGVRCRLATGIRVLADMTCIPTADLPRQAREIEAIGMDGLVVSLGHDPARYDTARREVRRGRGRGRCGVDPCRVRGHLGRAGARGRRAGCGLAHPGRIAVRDAGRPRGRGHRDPRAILSEAAPGSAGTNLLMRPEAGMAVTPFPARPWTQAAIDMFDLESALPIARMAVECGVDWLEVGTPLIYGEGFAAIRALKEIAGARSVVVDYKARDNCHMLFSEARKNGGDFATVSASGNDFGVIEALRARADCGIGVLADLYGLDTHEIAPRAMELAAMGVDGICIHFGNDQAAYDRLRQQYDGMREAKRAAPAVPVSCSADTLLNAIGACKQGADWVYFGADLVSSAGPEKYGPLRNYVETVHAFRRR